MARAAVLLVALGPFLIRTDRQWLQLQGIIVAAFVVTGVEVLARRNAIASLPGALAASSAVLTIVVATVLTRPGLAVFATASILWIVAFNPAGIINRSGTRYSLIAALISTSAFGVATALALTRPQILQPAAVVVVGTAIGEAWTRKQRGGGWAAEVAATDRLTTLAASTEAFAAAKARLWSVRLRDTTMSTLNRLARLRLRNRAVSCASLWRDTDGAVGLNSANARVATVVIPMCAFVLALIVGIRDVRDVLFDDAAITFRFAHRIANGDGFTFNDGDRTNGASAPLYTLILAAMRWVGADLQTTAKAIGCCTYAISIGLASRIAGRAGGTAAAMLTGMLLLASPEFRAMSNSGMESAFASALGLAAIAAWQQRREVLAGLIIGLAVVNKLDAGFLALALGLGAVVTERRVPYKMAATAAVTAIPWAAFAHLYFGSVIPYSAQQKMGDVANPESSFNPWWIVQTFDRTGDLLMLMVAIGSAAILFIQVATRPTAITRVGVPCALWAFGHFFAFSIIDLGDPYPWYTTVIFAPLAIAAGLAAPALAALNLPRLRPSLTESPRMVLSSAVFLVLIVATAARLPPVGLRILEGHVIDGYEAFDGTRRDAGIFLATVAEPGEVIRTCFGWISYGALNNPIQEICPLSTRKAVGPAVFSEATSWPGRGNAFVPPHGTIIRVVSSDVDPGSETIVFRCPGTSSYWTC